MHCFAHLLCLFYFAYSHCFWLEIGGYVTDVYDFFLLFDTNAFLAVE